MHGFRELVSLNNIVSISLNMLYIFNVCLCVYMFICALIYSSATVMKQSEKNNLWEKLFHSAIIVHCGEEVTSVRPCRNRLH